MISKKLSFNSGSVKAFYIISLLEVHNWHKWLRAQPRHTPAWADTQVFITIAGQNILQKQLRNSKQLLDCRHLSGECEVKSQETAWALALSNVCKPLKRNLTAPDMTDITWIPKKMFLLSSLPTKFKVLKKSDVNFQKTIFHPRGFMTKKVLLCLDIVLTSP